MVLKCGQFFILMVVLLNITIKGCFGVNRTSENCENSTISNKNGERKESLELSNKETLLEISTISSSNKIKDYFREIARKKGDSSSEEGSMMGKILPMLIIPFLISSSLIPPMLLSIKFLLIKSALIGKIAVILMLLNYFRRRVDNGGVYDHYPQDLMQQHYGYHGVEEPGVYVNKRRRRRRHIR